VLGKVGLKPSLKIILCPQFNYLYGKAMVAISMRFLYDLHHLVDREKLTYCMQSKSICIYTYIHIYTYIYKI
jgi:hypothetical protein